MEFYTYLSGTVGVVTRKIDVRRYFKTAQAQVLLCAIFIFLNLGRATAQAQSPSYGPPSFVDENGIQYSYTFTGNTQDDFGNNFYADWYSVNNGGGRLVGIGSDGGVLSPIYTLNWADNFTYGWTWYYNSTSSFYNPATGLFTAPGNNHPFAALAGDGLNFAGFGPGGLAPGIVVRTGGSNGGLTGLTINGNNSIGATYWTSAGQFGLAEFSNPPDYAVFNIGGSYYVYPPGQYLVLGDANGNMPPTNIFADAPTTVYVDGYAYYLTQQNPTVGQGSYSENLNYSDPSTNEIAVTINRNFVVTGGVVSFSGDITVPSDNGGTVSGTFDPNSWQVSGITSPAISFNNRANQPAYGPPFISWNGNLLYFLYTIQNVDYYADSANSNWVTIDSASNVTVSGLLSASGSYTNLPQPTFNFGGNQNLINFFALDATGEPSGLPAGLKMYFPGAGIGNQVAVSDGNQYSATYTFQKPNGTWGVKYIGLPANKYFVVSDSSGNFDSQIYVTSSGEMPSINATAGWPVSNAYPSQLYVNGISFPLHWEMNFVNGFGLAVNGGVLYISPDNASAVYLNWRWNGGQVNWTWSAGGQSGAWDGGSGFSNLPQGTFLSLVPPQSAPSYGPAKLDYNGTQLAFNPLDSQIAHADVYEGGGFRLTIGSDYSATMYASDGRALFAGTYTPYSQTFDFGIGTLRALDASGSVRGTSLTDNEGLGNLDVAGDSFTLGTWPNGTGGLLSGFGLTFAPPSSTNPAAVQFGSTVALTDWLWSHAVSNGAANQLTVMKLDSTNRLSLFAPNDSTTPKVVIDPVNGSGFSGTLRVWNRGDVSMGEFTNGTQPPVPNGAAN